MEVHRLREETVQFLTRQRIEDLDVRPAAGTGSGEQLQIAIAIGVVKSDIHPSREWGLIGVETLDQSRFVNLAIDPHIADPAPVHDLDVSIASPEPAPRTKSALPSPLISPTATVTPPRKAGKKA